MSDKEKLLILGAGGLGRAAAYTAVRMKRWDQIAFLDDMDVPDLNDFIILGSVKEVHHYIEDYEVFVAIGNNETRKNLLLQLEALNARIPILIHPKAFIGENVKLGAGTIVMAGAVIICNCTIGKGVIINTSSSVDHDSRIEDFVHISPGAHIAGNVIIGDSSWICIGATVINNLTITDHCTIGAGAVVIKSITEKGTYVGVPTRKL